MFAASGGKWKVHPAVSCFYDFTVGAGMVAVLSD